MKLQQFSKRTTDAQPASSESANSVELPTDTDTVISFDWLSHTGTSKPRIHVPSIRVTKFGVIISKPLAEAMAAGASEVRLRIGISKDKTAVGLMPTADGGMYSFKLDAKTIRVGATSLARKLTEVGMPLNQWVDVAVQNGVYVAHVPAA